MLASDVVSAQPSTAEPTAGTLDRLAVLGFATDEASESALRGGLSDIADTLQIKRGDIKACIRLLEREGTPRVLVVDVSGLDEPMRALDELAGVCTPDVRLLVIGERNDVGFYREITRDLGAAEYLFKPLTRDNVASLFGPHIKGLASQPVADRGGKIVTVSGARGGVGATTIAVNLAVHLAETTRGHVALLDLNLRSGTAAMMLGVQPGAGLRVALEHPERADALFLDRVATPVGERLRVLGAAEPFESEPVMTQPGIERLLKLLRSRFNTIIVDLPLPPTGAERYVFATARQRIIVLAPDLASVRDAVAAQRMVAALNGSSRTLMVVNRATLGGGLKANLIQEGLGVAPDCVIPEIAGVPRSANLGKPALHECAPFKKALEPLAIEVSGTVAAKARGGLASLLGLKRK